MNLISLSSEIFSNADLVGVYCNKESTDKFLVGRILSYSSTAIVLSLLSDDSSPDGLCFCATESIYRIEKNSQYLYNIKEKNLSATPSFALEDPWDSFLSYAENNNLVIQIKHHSSNRTTLGIPLNHSHDKVIIQRILPDGTRGRIISKPKQRIAFIVCNSESERKIQLILKGGKENVT